MPTKRSTKTDQQNPSLFGENPSQPESDNANEFNEFGQEKDRGAGDSNDSAKPLAERMRPRSLADFVGQEKAVGPGKILRRLIEKDELRSVIFWGPPGSGKTTLAEIIAHQTKARFVPFSAVVAGIKEVRAVMSEAAEYRRLTKRRTVLFIDEIHRFNRAQQDAFLPYVENGTIILIGATTENPSFEVNAALLSRSRVVVLESLTSDEIITIMHNALSDETRGLAPLKVIIDDDQLRLIANYASGDARVALNTLELAVLAANINETGHREIDQTLIKETLQRASLRYDKSGEEHYNLVSAFIKSIRNSDADAALYWLARMIEAGESPLFIARRLVHHAAEDIGLADPFALNHMVAAMQAVDFIGMPEARLTLAQATIYLALAPKSNSVYMAYMSAREDALNSEQEGVPLHLRNAPTSLMKNLGYGSGYQYAHDFEQGRATEMDCLPPALKGRKYYRPSEFGWEKSRRDNKFADLNDTNEE